MDKAELLRLMRGHKYAIESSVSSNGGPQSAIVGIAVSDELEIIFDSVDTTRKVVNLKAHPTVAFVVGGWVPGDERTVQYEGTVDFPTGDELARVQRLYFEVFPDGVDRLKWPGITHVRAKPMWVRVSDFTANPPAIWECNFTQDRRFVRQAAT